MPKPGLNKMEVSLCGAFLVVPWFLIMRKTYKLDDKTLKKD